MTISVIIVSYNVKYYLEHCLLSVCKAARVWEEKLGASAPEIEILVWDNGSGDGTQAYMGGRFDRVRFIYAAGNSGFAAGNNQALTMASGRYVLFLNPDTILGEDFFIEAMAFMDQHPRAGAMGVRMIDGSGHYLRESKRGFPGVWASFCKLSGLSNLFPHSRLFASYYLGHLDASQTQQVDALSGACMFCRKHVLDLTGGFDERFFMYAEDIDLSYRIQQQGFLNYYVPRLCIIHFKGESTRKDFRYVKQFYKAMWQFVEKHSGRAYPAISKLFLQLGITAGSGLSALKHAFRREQPARNINNGPFFLLGDPTATDRLRSYFGTRVATGPKLARATVYCEGPAFSFSEIIALLPATRKPKFVHAHLSRSLVGGGSSSRPGQAILMEMDPGP